MRCYLFDDLGTLIETGGEELIETWKGNARLQLWCDDTDPDVTREKKLLSNVFGIAPAAIAEAQKKRTPAKFEHDGDLYFVILKGLDPETDDMDFHTIQIAFLRGHNFLYTRHNGESRSTDRVWARVAREEKADLDRIVIDISAHVNARYLSLLFDLERRLEEIEDEILSNTSDTLLEELAHSRTDLKRMRRFLTYHIQVFEQFGELRPAGLNNDELEAVTKVGHSVARAHSLARLYDEQIADLMESTLSLSSHRLNQVMKVLTIITVIFVPLSFLAGIYGMNFENLPELHFRYGYFILLGIMFTIVLTALYVFRRIRWL